MEQPRVVSSAPVTEPPSIVASPSVQASPSSPASWTRPLDVKPIAPAGIFKVVSEAPSPGAKVPIFFMGAQF